MTVTPYQSLIKEMKATKRELDESRSRLVKPDFQEDQG